MEKKVDLSLYDNSWYNPGRSFFIRTLWYLINALVFNSYLFPVNSLKIILLKSFGAQIGKGCVVKPKVNIKYPWKLKIGEYCWVGERVWIDNLADVEIESNVCLSQGAMLLCGNHDFKKQTFDLMVKPIVLKQGAWIGAKATVCPDIVVNEYAVLSVGSVATTNLESNSIYQGVPAQKIKNRFN